jgi:hypothetical protein
MWERVATAREESDTTFFLNLLYLGEMVTKLVTAGLVAAITDERDKHRYRQTYRLVRVEGLGDWTAVIDDVLTGPPAQHLAAETREEQKELTQKCNRGTWQHDAVALLTKCLRAIDPASEELAAVTQGRRWFPTFAALRNRTRGHGATLSSTCCKLCPDLEESLRIMSNNYRLFQRPWAYLHRNLSGKYLVVGLTDDTSPFSALKSSRTANLADGIYVYFNEPARVQLIESNVDGAFSSSPTEDSTASASN